MLRPGRDRRGAASGFTLLEIIVTLFILTVILGAVSPVFIYSLRYNREDQAVRDFVAYLKFAQECAINHGVEYRVYLNPDEASFWVTRGTGDAVSPVEQPYAGRRRFPDTARIGRPKARHDRDRDAYYIGFYPNGACDYADVELTYGDSGRVEIKTKGNLGEFTVTKDDD